jgi:hypothetical protein
MAARSSATILRDSVELVGPLELVEPCGDGLIRVSVGGLERLVSDELEAKLRPSIDLWVGILWIDNHWSATERTEDGKWRKIA